MWNQYEESIFYEIWFFKGINTFLFNDISKSWLGMATIYIMAIFERHINPINLLPGINISGIVLFKFEQKISRCPPYLGGLP